MSSTPVTVTEAEGFCTVHAYGQLMLTTPDHGKALAYAASLRKDLAMPNEYHAEACIDCVMHEPATPEAAPLSYNSPGAQLVRSVVQRQAGPGWSPEAGWHD